MPIFLKENNVHQQMAAIVVNHSNVFATQTVFLTFQRDSSLLPLLLVSFIKYDISPECSHFSLRQMPFSSGGCASLPDRGQNAL